MQKPVHYNAVLYLGLCAGLPWQVAVEIAWADQYTDEVMFKALKGLGILDMPYEAIIIPFHFLPGNSKKKPWNCITRSPNAITLMKLAIESGNPLRLGMVLHTLQDTYSHNYFSGRDENSNAKYFWWTLVPSIGHMQFACDPDIIEDAWYDPRREKHIRNWFMGRRCLYDTLLWLRRYACTWDLKAKWSRRKTQYWIDTFIKHDEYDDRKKFVIKTIKEEFDIPDWALRFSKCNAEQHKTERDAFQKAAAQHVAEAQKLFPKETK